MDWNARFAASAPGVPGPPDALVGLEDLVPTAGRALEVACGRGTVAVWLALRGLAVDAVDAAPAGLALGAELARARDVHTVRWIEADLDDGLPVAPGYDVVVCQRFRDPALYPALVAALAPGGLLAVTVLSVVGDGGGRFRAGAGELRAAFAGLEVMREREGNGEATLVGRLSPPSRRPSRPGRPRSPRRPSPRRS